MQLNATQYKPALELTFAFKYEVLVFHTNTKSCCEYQLISTPQNGGRGGKRRDCGREGGDCLFPRLFAPSFSF